MLVSHGRATAWYKQEVGIALATAQTGDMGNGCLEARGGTRSARIMMRADQFPQSRIG